MAHRGVDPDGVGGKQVPIPLRGFGSRFSKYFSR